MTITTVAGACEATGWPGAFGFAAWCACWAAIWWAYAWYHVHKKPDQP